MKYINEKQSYIVRIISSNPSLIGGILLSAFLNFFLIDNKPLFLDEAASYLITQKFSSMFYILWNFEGNMWFYYLLLHLWTYIGTSETVLRSLSAIIATSTLIPVYLLAKQLFDKRVASIAMVLLPINLIFIKNAQYVRGYSLVILLTTISTLFFIKLLQKQTFLRLLAYITCSILACYTHLFAILVLGSHFLYLLYSNKLTHVFSLVKAYVIIGLGVLPLFLAPSIQSGQANWIPVPGIKELLASFYFLLGDFQPVVIIFILICLWFIIVKKNYKLSDQSLLLTIILINFPIFFAFLFSISIKPIYSIHYLSICLVPLVIFFSKALSLIHFKFLRYLLLIILILSVLRANSWFQSAADFSKTIPNQNADWKNAVEYLSVKAKRDDQIILLPQYSQITYVYYNNKLEYPINSAILPVQSINFLTLNPSQYHYEILESLPKKSSQVWLIEETGMSPNRDTKHKVYKALKRYTQKETKVFTNIIITRYEN